MKIVCRVLAVVVLLAAASVYAASFDGEYKFSARFIDGAPDMQSWNGTMTVKGAEMTRNYNSPDGAKTKFYTSTLKEDGKLYVMRHTKAYKPEYVGDEHKSKIDLAGNTLTIESEDGKFKEVWLKK